MVYLATTRRGRAFNVTMGASQMVTTMSVLASLSSWIKRLHLTLRPADSLLFSGTTPRQVLHTKAHRSRTSLTLEDMTGGRTCILTSYTTISYRTNRC